MLTQNLKCHGILQINFNLSVIWDEKGMLKNLLDVAGLTSRT
jgi:hypothetical protein